MPCRQRLAMRWAWRRSIGMRFDQVADRGPDGRAAAPGHPRAPGRRRARSCPDDRGWRFSHPLIHDTAYAGVLAVPAAQLHGRFADHLEARRRSASREPASPCTGPRPATPFGRSRCWRRRPRAALAHGGRDRGGVVLADCGGPDDRSGAAAAAYRSRATDALAAVAGGRDGARSLTDARHGLTVTVRPATAGRDPRAGGLAQAPRARLVAPGRSGPGAPRGPCARLAIAIASSAVRCPRSRSSCAGCRQGGLDEQQVRAAHGLD